MDLRLDELAVLLDVTEDSIRQWISCGGIPSYKINNELRFNREEVEDWLIHNYGVVTDEKKEDRGESKDLSLRYSLYRAIYRGGVLKNVLAESKEEVLRYTAHYIANKFELDPGVLFEMLMHRENLMSTGIGEGIALPHAKDFLINMGYDVVVPVFLSKSIEYGALDGKPVDKLFFLFASQDRNHLNLVNKIVHLGMSLEARQFLQGHPDQPQLLAFVKNWEAQIH
ncbi:PTS sugar transporter subunit IIA [Chlamydia sp.]|uniref:PTS sugar transporter subunit IIA n=1 Tax=Chlamydia sp. TaxID=35827 RepID=UPI0025BD0920|nr:PTS sugar transporter subunit IIA [Chlamydia sp.]MBQ8498309.1 PTS sugar transporter subunit IIA [Chlamydia sp.]